MQVAENGGCYLLYFVAFNMIAEDLADKIGDRISLT